MRVQRAETRSVNHWSLNLSFQDDFQSLKISIWGGVERYLHWTPSRWGDSFGSRLVRKLHAIRLSAYQQVIISEIAFISRASIKHAAAANFPSRVWPAGDLLMNRYAARRAKVFPGLSIKMSPFYCATKIQHFFLVHHVILEQNDARKRKQTLL